MEEQNLEWKCLMIDELLNDSYYGVSDSSNSDGNGYPVLRMGNMNEGKLDYQNLVHLEMNCNNFQKYRLRKGDILLNRTNSYELVGKISLFDSEEEYLCASYIVVLRPNLDIINPKYLNYYLNTEKLQKQIKVLATRGVSQANINPTVFRKKIEVLVPPLDEQEQIVNIISTWDLLIEKQEKIIQKKKEFMDGLLQRLLSGKVRFKEFNDEWKIVKLKDIIEESKEKSNENNQFDILSVTKDGIVLQSEYFNRQIASEDNTGYKVVRKNNLVFSSMNLWMGSIDILTRFDVGIVSPACKVFNVNLNKVDINYFKRLVRSKRMINLYNINSEQGASVVRRNLDLVGLLNSKIHIPSIEEQKKIGLLFKDIDNEIELLEKELESLKLQKKGLMQRLLTGEVRVKV